MRPLAPRHAGSAAGHAPASAAPVVEVRSANYAYPSGRRGVVALDLRVEPGERVVVLGPNGSGKSTLVHLLSGVIEPSTGTVSVLGVDPARSAPALRGRIGVALDRPVHWEALTGLENATLLARASGLGRRAAAAAAAAALARFSLELHVPVGEYSLGMKRRLLLGEAFAHRPELLLLDEPTLGLDPPSTEALAAALEEHVAAGGAAVVATNDVAAAPYLGTRVAFLLEGGKVADEPLDAILSRLRARTRLEVSVDPALGPAPGELVSGGGGPPGTVLGEEGGLLVAESVRGVEPLPDLLRWLLDRGASVRDVRVREPDLSDAFRELTGAPLDGPRP